MSKVRPIFLLSMPRAGSTLLQRLMLASGRCATLGEPSLLLRFLGEGDVMTRKSVYWESLVEMGIFDMREAWSGYDETYREGVRNLMLPIYEGLAKDKGWFLDKTPRYTLIAEELIRTFPDAKFVVLWRHPLAVAASISSTFCRNRWFLDEYSIDLCEGLDRLHAFASEHPDSICQIRYEDLVTDPEGELARLGEYMGWEDLAKVAREDLPTSAGGTHGDPTGVKKYKKVSASSLDAWRETMTTWYRRAWARDYFSSERSAWLKELGYELPADIAGKSWMAGKPLKGISEWVVARMRIHRRHRQPKWLPRFSKSFREKHGYEVSFR